MTEQRPTESSRAVVGAISLGCDKNRVDTETILTSLAAHGYAFSDDEAACDVLLVNTCAFLEAARDEAVEAILDAARYKKGRCKALVVTGCLPLLYPAELAEQLPEVDLWATPKEYDALADRLDALLGKSPEVRTPSARLVTTPPHYAYLKIADGCDNNCTYCLIPTIRGRYRSRPPRALLDEARGLVENGARELILVAQDTTRYGCDDPSFGTLAELVHALDGLDGLETIRLLYCYPERVTDELIACFSTCKKLAPYIDLPLQHVSDRVLRRMNRRSSRASIESVLARLRAACPSIAIRTTLMVGFPGETDADIDELCDFLRREQLDHVGFFAFSREEGTPAFRMRPQVPAAVKQARLERVRDVQIGIAEQKARKRIGTVVRARYESIDYDRNCFVARPLTCAPEIDPVIYFTADFAEIGSVYDLLVTGTDGCDLIARRTE